MSVILILDCESVDTTALSLERIIGIAGSEITRKIGNLDLEKHYENHPDEELSAPDLVFQQVVGRPPSKFRYDETRWFHLTRSLSTEAYSSGIKPLGTMTDFLWNQLFLLVSDWLAPKEWEHFREDVETTLTSHHARLYRLKTSDSFHWGPYAMLVREAAFRAVEMGNHDYLRAPEIVEDICICFQERFKFNLLDLFTFRAQPLIVKFGSSLIKPYYLATAMYYLYTVYHGNQLSIHTNTCYDGKNTVVAPNDIVYCELIPQ